MTTWLRIEMKDEGRRRYEEIPNGPFPIEPEQLDAARREFAGKKFGGYFGGQPECLISTLAMPIVEKHFPHLDPFPDQRMIAHAVAAERVRYEVVDPPP